MYRIFNERLERLIREGHGGLLRGGSRGIEKESLRVAADGSIARTPHPEALGSALTHPHITTDYSEALLEFITAPSADVREPLRFLADVHRFVYEQIGDELLWATSMPCVVASDESIPIAYFGRSNSGTMKHVYRRGLKHRYGGLMQVIAGVHFNYSLPLDFWPVYQRLGGGSGPLREFIDGAYFGLIRNVLRFSWLVPYLFGSSPAVCKTFLKGREGRFAELDHNTLYEPHATSLRMSDIGYTNKCPAGLDIVYDDLQSYVQSLSHAIETPFPAYQRIGIKRAGEYLQLNANILQIENEYYSSVRPKRTPRRGERPTVALQREGVAYVEVRSLDVDPFSPIGVNEHQLRFLEAFLIFCLLHESPRISADERREIDANLERAADRGREPDILLRRHGRGVPLLAWADELLREIRAVCAVLDDGQAFADYTGALDAQVECVRDPDRTPSARVLAELREHREGFFEFALRQSDSYKRDFARRPLDDAARRAFHATAQASMHDQRQLEASDRVSFDEYLRHYFAQRIR